MSETVKAVFLSYAREDAPSARRIAEALRATGLEVWFDENELRGGDAWDAKIRKQIDACALFIPIVSQHTQSRGKGYFRLEWKLAVEQTHLMAEGMAYLAPVVIDDTPESGALVPPEFLKVQWTRLPGALPTPAFVAQIRRLLGKPAADAPSPSSPAVSATVTASSPATAVTKSRVPAIAGVALAVGAIGAAIYFFAKPSAPDAKSATLPVELAAAAKSPAPVSADSKSIAVLPFANLSGDKDQEYFSDGLTEEILNALARERDLRVPGRASAFSFKGKSVTAAEIGHALNVSRLVEGSVRRSGNKVRISVQLTRISDGFSEELGTFTEELTDVFALQDKIARAVVEKVTSRRSIASTAMALTRNPAAYDAYLKGRALQTRSASTSAEAVKYYEQAVAADPTFALAWVRLAEARFRPWGAGADRSPALAEATRAAIDRALELQPDLAEALVMRANWLRAVKSDFAAAQADLARAESLQPANSTLRQAQALLARSRSDWTEAIQRAEECLALDPQNGDYTNAFGVGFYMLRGRVIEADRLFARAIAIQAPSAAVPLNNRVALHRNWRGPDAALRVLEDPQVDPEILKFARAVHFIEAGWVAEARVLVEQLLRGSKSEYSVISLSPRSFSSSQLAAVGLAELARERAEFTRQELLRELARGNRAPSVLGSLISAEIHLGHKESALALLKDWKIESARHPDSYVRVTEFNRRAAELYARLGQTDEAIALLEEYWELGYRQSLAVRDFDSLRSSKRFQKLLERQEEFIRSLPPFAEP